MSEDEAQYNDSNRAFLQAFMARGSLTFEEAKPILAFIFSVHEGREVLSEDITQQDIDSYIGAANAAISPLDLEIRSASHQASRTRVYALVNTTSDSMMQLATTYTADEIGFVKRVLDAMFETYNTRRQEAMVITSMQAVQLAKPDASRRETQNGSATQGSSGQGLSMSQAENMLKRLVEEGWFEKSRKGYYSLSPRALLELRGWLVSTYNEAADEDAEENTGRNDRIKFCYACKEIITVGQRCARRDCPCRLHDICTQNFFRVQRSQLCPLCRTEWTGQKHVGEKAVTTTEQHLQGKRRSGGARERTSGLGEQVPNGEDEEADGDG